MKYWYSKDFHPENIKYPHYILLDGGNTEGLLQSWKKAMLTNKVVDWLNENIGEDSWTNVHGTLLFTEKESAMAFMLKWS